MSESERKIAVVTDSTHNGFYFPLWHAYYSKQFGADNLYVITSLEGLPTFRDIQLGGIWRVTHSYDDNARARTMTAAVGFLLTSYDFVIRVDADEFLIPDLRRFPTLQSYLNQLDRPYVTARGYNILEAPGDTPVDFSMPILVNQRRLARAESAMNKTCVTSVPFVWGPGGHFCSAYPMFDNLYLMHLKRCDIDTLVAWGKWMLPQVGDNKVLQNYYGQEREKYVAFNTVALNKPIVEGWEGLDKEVLDTKFLNDTVYDRRTTYYRGQFLSGEHIASLPIEFQGVL